VDGGDGAVPATARAAASRRWLVNPSTHHHNSRAMGYDVGRLPGFMKKYLQV
jgi:hypothetical protein